MKSVMQQYLLTAFFILAITATAAATVRPSSLFSHHMVLQKGVAVPVWGHADEGEKRIAGMLMISILPINNLLASD
jgi:hypothetical protein